MMVAVFATLCLAFVLGWTGRRDAALAVVALCLAVSVAEFLWEVWSPDYGFRMPWIQTEISGLRPVVS